MKKSLYAIIFLLFFLMLLYSPTNSRAADEAAGGGGAKKTSDEVQGAAKGEDAEKAAKEAQRKKLPPIKMIYIEGGCFDMGDFTGRGDEDERPVHRVCVTDYYLSATEVTNELWEAVMGFESVKDAEPQQPASHVDWFWANRFLVKLNDLTDGFYRLPTEAEWEFAARERGRKIRWSGTNHDEDLENYAWMAYNSEGKIHDVKQKKPNSLGLYDMSGNVWEWVDDLFDFDYYKTSEEDDPYGPDFSVWRAMRGGSAVDVPYKLRTTYRYASEPKTRALLTGFRIAE